jgi:ornithine cyclodeaminase/alanine dehydrogenase-like protein (mu-crystallin family)
MQLGDLGAGVIKIEPPEGDYTRELGPPFLGAESGIYLALNRSKRSVVLDLSSPEGRESLTGLLDGADVLISATNAPEPVLDAADLEAGQHLNAMGIKTELTPALVAACRVIGDGREEALGDGKFSVALAAGAVGPADLGPDLGAVLAGMAPGRTDAEQITMFDSSGVALQDVACARAVWERAEREDAGVVVDIAGGDVLASAEAAR